MHFPKQTLQEINTSLDVVIERILEFEKTYAAEILNVHPNYIHGARNLVHYLATRSFNLNFVQEKLQQIGLPSLPETQNNVLYSLLNFKTIINSLLNKEGFNYDMPYLTNIEADLLCEENSKALLGSVKNKRKTAILVTQPSEAATDKSLVKALLKQGMDCARINCAHDDKAVWKQIIDTIRSLDKTCKIMMDLGGPKLRTGSMTPGPKVIQFKPKKNKLGQVIKPAKIWLAPYGVNPPDEKKADAIVPVNKNWLRKTRKGSFIMFRDSRNKKRKMVIEEKTATGRWASCDKSAFLTPGTLLNVFLEDKTSFEIHAIQKLLPLEEVILLFEGDLLRLDRKNIPGEPAVYDADGSLQKMAHIACTLPEVFDYIKVGEPIYFNDGKIEGRIKEHHTDHIIIEITNAKKTGSKLRSDKGINLPNSKLRFSGLTEKDKKDIRFVVKNADVVNYSFVNTKEDVQSLQDELKKLKAQPGIVLKIETQDAYRNLPVILLKAMENYPIGVMIARGDLAIETGWKNFAIIQEEILLLCEAAQIPDIWATQVLENLAKKGIPTRAEITDAAMAQRADCVMLNKGPYIEKTVRMLDKVLIKMQKIQKKNKILLPKLEFTLQE